MKRWLGQMQWRLQKRRFRRAQQRRKRDQGRPARPQRPARHPEGSGREAWTSADGSAGRRQQLMASLVLTAVVAFALSVLAWANETGSSFLPDANPLVIAPLFVLGIVVLVHAVRRLPEGPPRTVGAVIVVLAVVAGLGYLTFLFSFALSSAVRFWPLFALVFFALIGVWSWRLGRE